MPAIDRQGDRLMITAIVQILLPKPSGESDEYICSLNTERAFPKLSPFKEGYQPSCRPTSIFDHAEIAHVGNQRVVTPSSARLTS
jgi:hypothetical protein